MNILFALAEAFPFIKAGGLGDVGGSLPGALLKEGADVRVIMPRYRSIPEELLQEARFLGRFTVNLSWRKRSAGLLEVPYGGVTYYLIEEEEYFGREGLYGYFDDGERFAFFSKAVLEALALMKDFPVDILHCHDWHAAAIPLFLKEQYGKSPRHQKIRSLLTIHNLRHQGFMGNEAFGDLLGFGNNQRKAYNWLAYEGQLNLLKGGLMAADLISTVSPAYAREIQTPYYGEGLEEVIRYRSRDLSGILNGIDSDKYKPLKDKSLWVNFRSSLDKKGENKLRLQEELGLPVGKDIPMAVMVTRLVDQKGLDLLAHILPELLTLPLELVILGTGEPRYETILKKAEAAWPEKLRALIRYDEGLAHKLYASGDLLLMPSLFEPCGLSQMIAMAYGTLPVVRETGGLKDSVIPYNQFTGEGTGFTFTNYNAHEFLDAVRRAVGLYRENPAAWKALADNALAQDFSWKKSAGEYMGLYHRLLSRK